MRYFLVPILLASIGLSGQDHKIDSLLALMEISHDSSKVEVLLELSEQFYYQDFAKAGQYARQAVALARKLGQKEEEIKSTYKLGTILFNINDSLDSRAYLEQGLKMATDLKNESLVAKGCYHLSKYYEKTGNFPQALEYINRSLNIYAAMDQKKEIASCLTSLGLIYNRLANYDKSLDFYFKALYIYESLEDSYGIPIVFTNIGNIYLLTSKLDDANDYFLKALSFDRENEDKEGILSSFLNLGVVNQKKGEMETAITYFKEALELARRLNLRYDEAILLGNIGSTYRSQNKYKESLSYLHQAMEIKKDLKQWGSLAHTYNDLGETYLAMGNPLEAKRYAWEAVNLSKDINLDQQREGYDLLAQSAYRLGELISYDYLQKANSIKDSIFTLEATSRMDELEMRYETRKKEEEIVELTAQRQAAEFKRKAYLAAGIMSTVLLLLLFNQQRLKTLKNKELLIKEQEVEVMKSKFFANISHEFRTPLTLILAPIETIRSHIKDPRIHFHIDIMKRNANKLLGLINQVLDLSKLEAGKFKLEVVREDLLPIVKGVTMAFHSMAEMKGIALKFSTDTEHLQAYVDKEKLEAILVNLISNAIKFTSGDGSITVMFSTETPLQPDPFYIIKVKDDGRGIPGEDIAHLFDRFYQGTGPKSDGYEGSGIGLALTKELVELHHGHIEVESHVGIGTEISIRFPSGKNHFKEDELKANASSTPNWQDVPGDCTPGYIPMASDDIDLSRPIILLVEDNVDVMQYLRDIFQDQYQVLQAKDGQQGIVMAQEQIPDLIISDVMMPKANGYEVCQTLKQDVKTSHIPIILLTAKAGSEDKIEGLQTSADDYVIKPFLPKELLLRVKNLIRSRQTLREKYLRELVLKPSEITVNSIDESFLERMLKVVEDNIGNEQFGVEQLGLAIGMSRSQLHRKLRALLDQAPNQFIRSFRLQRAHDLLKQKAGTAAEISYQVGFGSPSYFTKCFHEQYGYTPSELHNHLPDLPSF